MKKALLAVLLLAGCQKKEYHIIVYESYGLFYINYTNDNWKSREGLIGCNEIGIDKIIFFPSKESAVNVAKKLKTYEDCVRYNDSVRANCSPAYIKIY